MGKGVVFFCVLLFLWVVPSASAQDFIEEVQLGAISGAGARSAGMGGAFLAVADDSTAISWNPAGLALLKEPEAALVWKTVGDFDVDLSAYQFEQGLPGQFGYREQGSEFSVSRQGNAIDFAAFAYPLSGGSFQITPAFSYQRVLDFGLDLETTVFKRMQLDVFDGFYSAEQAKGEFSGGLDVWSGGVGFNLYRTLDVGLTFHHWGNGADKERVIEAEVCFLGCERGTNHRTSSLNLLSPITRPFRHRRIEISRP